LCGPERFFKVKRLDLGGSDHNSGEKLDGRPQGTLARISGSDTSRLFHRRGTRPGWASTATFSNGAFDDGSNRNSTLTPSWATCPCAY